MSKIGVISLGCAKNLVDTEIVLGFLTEAGHEIVSDPLKAEVIIVNTCGFIEDAKEESINAILEMADMKENGVCEILIVMGCLSQRYREELWEQIPEIDGLVGTNELDLITELLDEISTGKRIQKQRDGFFNYDHVHKRLSTTGTHFAYLKVAEGCNHSCAFCVIPQIRGKFRSRNPKIILQEAQELVQHGALEIAVIAQDTTFYGKDLGTNIVELLKELAKLTPGTWLRLLYTYPTSISDELLALISETDNLLKYVDLPLQHVSSNVLRKMKRPGDYSSTVDLIEKIRKTIPGVTIRSSFIVGFPGETEEDFQELLNFLSTMRLNHVGIFKYSQEENSSAFNLENQVPEEIKTRRYEEAMALQQAISFELNKQLVGSELEVLLEYSSEESDLVLIGRHPGQAPDVDGVVYVGRGDLQPGQIVKVRIVEAHPYDLVGEVVDYEFA